MVGPDDVECVFMMKVVLPMLLLDTVEVVVVAEVDDEGGRLSVGRIDEYECVLDNGLPRTVECCGAMHFFFCIVISFFVLSHVWFT